MASFTPALPLSGFFKYCLIAADDSKPIEEFKASKAGGLSDDAVRAAAETRFSSVELDRSRQAEAMAEQMKEKGMGEVDISNMLKNYCFTYATINNVWISCTRYVCKNIIIIIKQGISSPSITIWSA